MDVFSAIQARRSIRAYSAREVEEEKLNRVLEAGRLAPSANNRQDWKFIVVRDRETRKRLVEAAGGQQFLGTAPVVLVVCGTEPEKVMMCGQPAYAIDASIALSFMILEACELGLGTCWLGHFDENRVKEILGIPPGVRVVAMTPLGYPAESPAARPRKSLDEVVSYERF
ncbi:MAG TPA: nitroreductase [Syntrophomonadaceae bacterium]|nr:nitroreductase [Syntrophomonadaceae bacterium]